MCCCEQLGGGIRTCVGKGYEGASDQICFDQVVSKDPEQMVERVCFYVAGKRKE